MDADDLTWEAPGPGDWWVVKEHMPYAVTQSFAEIFPAVTRGWKTSGARYGLPTGEAQWGFVNGWCYFGPQVPLSASELADREPTAAATLSGNPWRDEVRIWHDEQRPAAIAANRELQAVVVALLDDGQLLSHHRAAIELFSRLAPLHFEHAGFDVVAGMLFAATGDWGVDPAEMTPLLAGFSPGSGAVDRHVTAIARALDAAGAADPLSSLDEVRAASTDAAHALDSYLDEYGWRPLAGHDVLEPTLIERPQLVMATINARRKHGPRAMAADRATVVRASVPEEHRERFDELLRDARASYALRDDDVGVCFNWPLGLVRRAALEIGGRLVDRGVLTLDRHILEATMSEVALLVADGSPEVVQVVESRWRTRELAEQTDPPQHLGGGGEMSPPPDLSASVARLSDLRSRVWRLAPKPIDEPLHGVGVNDEVAVGSARCVRHPEQIIDVVAGEVLVAVATTAAFNTVFPLVAAVVTEHGGLFSHAAILSREVGVPAVLGVADVFDHIHDGDLVEVDPVARRVRVIESAS